MEIFFLFLLGAVLIWTIAFSLTSKSPRKHDSSDGGSIPDFDHHSTHNDHSFGDSGSADSGGGGDGGGGGSD